MIRIAEDGGKLAIVAALGFALAGLAVAARADAPAGDVCAGKLTADGKAIYASAVEAAPSTETLKSVMEKVTRSLAMGGKIARGEARANAEAAAGCMRARLQ